MILKCEQFKPGKYKIIGDLTETVYEFVHSITDTDQQTWAIVQNIKDKDEYFRLVFPSSVPNKITEELFTFVPDDNNIERQRRFELAVLEHRAAVSNDDKQRLSFMRGLLMSQIEHETFSNAL